MATLPCHHEERIVRQVSPTVNLLVNMDELHPEVLRQHGIEPYDYRHGLVFRSAVEQIRGRFIASSTNNRQALVADILENLARRDWIADYQPTSTNSRCDFSVVVEREPDYFAAIEVKGGEGNSINISEPPVWAREFAVWCHLDGAIVNQPAHGAHSIINRLTNELTQREKSVDIVFFKDVLCGTRTRPCPKYPGREEELGLLTAPDVFLLPQRIPSLAEPEPPAHTLDTLKLPKLILDLFGIAPHDRPKHVWQVYVKVFAMPDGRMRRQVRILHQDEIVDESISRPWTPRN